MKLKTPQHQKYLTFRLRNAVFYIKNEQNCEIAGTTMLWLEQLQTIAQMSRSLGSASISGHIISVVWK